MQGDDSSKFDISFDTNYSRTASVKDLNKDLNLVKFTGSKKEV